MLFGSLPAAMWIVILAGTVIRGGLVTRGQYLFPDEARYDRGLDFWDACFEFEPARAVTSLFKAKGRPGAVVAYLPISLVQWGVMGTFELRAIETSWIPAMFTTVLAGLNTILLHRLSRRLFKDQTTCMLCAILYGLCAPGLYFAQFLVPYIAAQTFLLASLLMLPDVSGLDTSRRRLVLSGVLFGFGFATYPGLYDQVVLLVILVLAAPAQAAHLPARGGRAVLRQAVELAWLGVGALSTLLAFEALSRLGWGPSYVASLGELKGLIKQGDFAEVWKFPFVFGWSADGALSVLLGIGLLGAIIRVAVSGSRRRLIEEGPAVTSGACHGRLGLLLVALAVWYGWRVVDGWRESQVLYGRLVFQAMPLLCLVGGAGLAYLVGNRLATQRRLAMCAVAAAVWAMVNMWPFFHAITPAKFEHDWMTANPDSTVVAYVTSLAGTRMMAEDHHELDDRLRQGQAERSPGDRPIVMANTEPMWPVLGFREPQDLDAIRSAWHPLNIPALQYEGWNRSERSLLQARTVWMRVLEAPPQAARHEWLRKWGGHKVRP